MRQAGKAEAEHRRRTVTGYRNLYRLIISSAGIPCMLAIEHMRARANSLP